VYERCNALSSADVTRLLREAKLFDAKLGQIDGAGNTGTYLIHLVEAKVVVAQTEGENKKSEEKKEAESAKPDVEKHTAAAS
jgi:vacuolar protein sorting-associated protein 54